MLRRRHKAVSSLGVIDCQTLANHGCERISHNMCRGNVQCAQQWVSATKPSMDNSPSSGEHPEPSRSGQMTRKLRANTSRRAHQTLRVLPKPRIISIETSSPKISTAMPFPFTSISLAAEFTTPPRRCRHGSLTEPHELAAASCSNFYLSAGGPVAPCDTAHPS
jgi:hypothetical protein